MRRSFKFNVIWCMLVVCVCALVIGVCTFSAQNRRLFDFDLGHPAASEDVREEAEAHESVTDETGDSSANTGNSNADTHDTTARYSSDASVHQKAQELMDVDASYEDAYVLMSFTPGTTAAAANQALLQVSQVAAERDLTQAQVDEGCVRLAVAKGYTVEDAVVALSALPVISNAQPNYLYTIASDNTLATDLQNPAMMSAAAEGMASAAEGTAAQSAEQSDEAPSGSLGAQALKAQVDEVSINDPHASRQWALASVDAYAAWAYLVNADGKVQNTTGVAVLDSGFDVTHEDLVANISTKTGFFYNAYSNEAYNSANNKTANVADTAMSHGTHVAGIISGIANNGIGVAGISYNAPLSLVKVLGPWGSSNMSGESYMITRAIKAVTAQASKYNIRVMNLSIGEPKSGKLLKNVDNETNNAAAAANAAGIVCVAAAGNQTKANGYVLPYEDFPADNSAFVSVINLTHSGTAKNVARSTSSNYNVATKDDGTSPQADKNISAPGTSILSTVPGGYGYSTGTSMASPLVAGIFSLVFAKAPSLTASQAKCIVYSTAVDITNPSVTTEATPSIGVGWDRETGYGEVNALAAMQCISPTLTSTLTNNQLTYGNSAYLSLQNGVTSPTSTGLQETTWTSSAPDVVAVDSKGQITGLKPGTSTITVSYTIKDKEGDSYQNSASLTITVVPANVETTPSDFEITLLDTKNATVAKNPTVMAKYKGQELALGSDYTAAFTYTSGVSSTGESVVLGTCILTFKGNYTGTYTWTFDCSKESISSASVTVAAQQYAFGRALEPAVTVAFGGKELKLGTDYTVSYQYNSAVGTAQALVTGTGVFQDSVSTSFSITQRDLSNATIELYDDNGNKTSVYTFGNKEITPTVKVKLTVSAPVAGSDVVSGSGSGSGSVAASGVTQTITQELVEGRDYTVAYHNNFAASLGQGKQASITITGIGNYTGVATTYFTINQLDLNKANISASVSSVTYTGSKVYPRPVIYLFNPFSTLVPGLDLYFTLAQGVDYSLSGYTNNINAGTGRVTIVGRGNYTGSRVIEFTITPAYLSVWNTSVTAATQTYTGRALTPAPTVSVTLSGGAKRTLTQGVDYTVSYTNNVQVGTATITITGKGNYQGSATGYFKINAASVNTTSKPTTSTPSVSKPTTSTPSVDKTTTSTPSVSKPTTSTSSKTLTRLSGAGRMATMQKIVQTSFSSAKTVIIASAYNFPDALCASSLAGAYKAPVILTEPNRLSAEARTLLQNYKPTQVFIVGGTSAISQTVENTIKSLTAQKPKRLAGASRQDTSAQIYTQLKAKVGTPKRLVVATGTSFADALSIGPWCYATNTPILLASQGSLSQQQLQVLRSTTFDELIIVGGTEAVPQSITRYIKAKKIKRLSGVNRYATSKEIALWEIKQGLGTQSFAVATGQNFPDALAGAAALGSKKGIILLAETWDTQALGVIAPSMKEGYILGGTSAVSTTVENSVRKKMGL